jgi:hypothetical protein
MISDFSRGLEYHTGIRPREYYEAKAKRGEAQREQNELKVSGAPWTAQLSACAMADLRSLLPSRPKCLAARLNSCSRS